MNDDDQSPSRTKRSGSGPKIFQYNSTTTNTTITRFISLCSFLLRSALSEPTLSNRVNQLVVLKAVSQMAEETIDITTSRPKNKEFRVLRSDGRLFA